jgi:hypothetical protein
LSIVSLWLSHLDFLIFLHAKRQNNYMCLQISKIIEIKITIHAFSHLTFKRFASLLFIQRTIYLLSYLPWRGKWNTSIFFRFLLRLYSFLFSLSYLLELWAFDGKIWMLKHCWCHWLFCWPLDCSFTLKEIIFDLLCDVKLKAFKLILQIN